MRRRTSAITAAAPHLLAPAGAAGPAEHVLIIAPAGPVILNRRLWQECRSLVAADYRVSVICPRGPDDPPEQWLDGVHVYGYRPTRQSRSLTGTLIEHGYAWLRTASLSLTVWRRHRFTVIQAGDPPDDTWLLARLWRGRHVTFVHDQQVVRPQLLRTRAGTAERAGDRAGPAGLGWLERMTHRMADPVITADEPHRDLAQHRGRPASDEVTVLLGETDPGSARPIYPTVRRPAPFCLAYLGSLMPGSEVELIIDVLQDLVRRRGRRDVHLTLLGVDEAGPDLRRRITELGLAGQVSIMERTDQATIAEQLSLADVGLDPTGEVTPGRTAAGDRSVQYPAFALPAVAFGPSPGHAPDDGVRFAPVGEPGAFTDEIVNLLDDPRLRVQLGIRARQRASTTAGGRARCAEYVEFFDRLTDHPRRPASGFEAADPAGESFEPRFDAQGRRYVDLADEAELRRFVRERTNR